MTAFKVPREQLESAIPAISVVPHLVTVYNCVKQFCAGTIDECSVGLYGFPQGNPELWLALKHHRYSVTQFLMQSSTEDKQLIAEGVRAILELTKNEILALDKVQFVASDAITQSVKNEFEASGTHPFITCYDPYTMFYMNNEQCERLMSEEVTLPQGFAFEELEAERDVNLVVSPMLYAAEGDREQAKSRIQTMPSVAVRHLLSDRIVSFEYNSGYGHITNLYTFPNFRGIGLGSAVERRLCQLVISELKITPVKQVSRCRPRVIEMSKKSAYWSTHQDSDGSDHLGYYTVFRKQPAPVFQMIEN